MQTIEITAYTFAELSETAKARVLPALGMTDDWEPEFEPIETAGRILGISFDTRPVKLYGGGTRFDPDFSYEIGVYRGTDYFGFTGTMTRGGGVKAMRAEFGGKDGETLTGIARRWEALQKRNFYRLSARVHTNHSNWCGGSCRVSSLERFGDDWENERATEEAQGIVDDFCAWACALLLADYEYRHSEEYFAEMCDANEYRFDESGRML
jgi:hypothetical protein